MKHIGEYRSLSKGRPGYGGLNCTCCNPAVGNLNGKGAGENKRRLRRMYRRTVTKQLELETNDEAIARELESYQDFIHDCEEDNLEAFLERDDRWWTPIGQNSRSFYFGPRYVGTVGERLGAFCREENTNKIKTAMFHLRYGASLNDVASRTLEVSEEQAKVMFEEFKKRPMYWGLA